MYWYVCDMDDGVLRREDSRKAALAWLCDHYLTKRVLSRHTYAPGDYEYHVGDTADDEESAWIIREDRMSAGGWDREQEPLYPQLGALAHEQVSRSEAATRAVESLVESG